MATVRGVRWATRLGRWGVMLLAGCDWNVFGPSSCVASVTVSPPSATVQVGQTVQLYATARDTAGHVLSNEPVTWGSNNTAIATVDPAGLVTGVGAGQTAVTATSAGQSGQSDITVTAAPKTARPPTLPPFAQRARSDAR